MRAARRPGRTALTMTGGLEGLATARAGGPRPGGGMDGPGTSVAGAMASRRGGGLAVQGIAALLLGAAAPLALAPLHWLPFIFLSHGGLFLLLERAGSVWRAFLLGWLFGLGSFVVGLHWITEAFAVDAARFGALALPALLGLGALLAAFPALSAAAAHALAGERSGWRLAAAFSACWAAGEWLRGTLLTGFPWNLIGYAWGFADAPLQAAALVGIHGLGLVTILLAVLPALAFRARRRWCPPLLCLAGLGLLWGYGALRLQADPLPDVPGVRLRLVQPDVPQALKWAPEERERILARLIGLSLSPTAGDTPPTHVIWSESAVPYLLAEEPAIRSAVAAAVPPGGALVTGAVRRVAEGGSAVSLRNSVVVLDRQGEILDTYDKIRLVPFGEYVPLRGLLARLPKLTVGSTDFTPGTSRAPLPVPGLPGAWPLICYEAIFPAGLPADGPRPGYILTVTNDAWFGTSWGPHQHALAARLRAVELGLPLVRAANGGISLVTDAQGRVRATLPLATSGVLDAGLPGAIPDATLYACLGDGPFGVSVLLLGMLAMTRRRKRAA
ncbi:apolipoprotein N-acyltransferase [Muricoccus radiodurans]|uniref:apolipoprotein N-acyltransferase n=1 Tax=Muricoccus radiodurans TaxID=2231721 RepID=UPI003CEE4360